VLYSEDSVIAATFVDARGIFMLDNVPAGSYRMVVTVSSSGPAKRSARSEQTIVVNDNTLTEVVVLIDMPTLSPGP
jgi:hypothetical protein